MQLIRGGNKGAIAATVGLELLAILILMPATTPTILDANNRPLPGSIASLEKPVLLYLSQRTRADRSALCASPAQR